MTWSISNHLISAAREQCDRLKQKARQVCVWLHLLPTGLSQQHQDTLSAEGDVTGALLAFTANGRSCPNVNTSAAPEKNAKPSQCCANWIQAILTSRTVAESRRKLRNEGSYPHMASRCWIQLNHEVLPKLEDVRPNSESFLNVRREVVMFSGGLSMTDFYKDFAKRFVSILVTPKYLQKDPDIP